MIRYGRAVAVGYFRRVCTSKYKVNNEENFIAISFQIRLPSYRRIVLETFLSVLICCN